ncbi:hypothetical protein [Streptomyces sp. NPDC058045]|uniref:hypothetical protein n=1 Tax=Streptomyces sp. NPDC058045 TaxID=3346311 RepID=UPI0036DFC5F5
MTLLIAAAVSAVSGCTTVAGDRAPRPAASTVRPAATSASATPRGEPTGARGDVNREAPRVRPASRAAVPPAPPPRPPVRTPAAAPPPPAVPVPVPVPPGASLPSGADVCAYGRQFGGWRPGSAEARICRHAYGR